MSNIFFTSDTHFGHTKLVQFRNTIHGKSFNSVEEWDEYIIDSWNSIVTKRDIVWHLGDVAFGSSNYSLIDRLKGRKHLVLGNHDSPAKYYMNYFQRISGVEKRYGIVMSHCPIHINEMVYRWNLNVHGHIHHVERLLGHPYRCVSLDTNAMQLVPLEEIKTLL